VGLDGERSGYVELIFALEIGYDKDASKKKDLRESHETIRKAPSQCSYGTGHLGALAMM
jgi:hypothetical protein